MLSLRRAHCHAITLTIDGLVLDSSAYQRRTPAASQLGLPHTAMTPAQIPVACSSPTGSFPSHWHPCSTVPVILRKLLAFILDVANVHSLHHTSWPRPGNAKVGQRAPGHPADNRDADVALSLHALILCRYSALLPAFVAGWCIPPEGRVQPLY